MPSPGAVAGSDQVVGVQPPPQSQGQGAHPCQPPLEGLREGWVHLPDTPQLVPLHLNASAPTSPTYWEAWLAAANPWLSPALWVITKLRPTAGRMHSHHTSSLDTGGCAPREENGLRVWLTCTVLTTLVLRPSPGLGDTSPLLQPKQPDSLSCQPASSSRQLWGHHAALRQAPAANGSQAGTAAWASWT